MEPRSTSRSTRTRRRAAGVHDSRGPGATVPDGGAGDEGLVVARILGPHGLGGEVRLDPRTDVPDRLRPGAVLLCDGVGPLTMTSLRGETSSPIVRFEGYESRSAADALQGRFLRVSRSEARRATEGAYLWADLVGLAAETPDGRPLGVVRDLIRAGETDVLVVGDPGRELLLPMLESVVRSVDVPNGRIVLAPQEELG